MLRHIVRNGIKLHVPRVDLDRVLVDDLDLRAERSQDFEHDRNVADVRNIFDAAYVLRQDRARNDRQRGVLRAADVDPAVQRMAAVDDQFVHTQRFTSHR